MGTKQKTEYQKTEFVTDGASNQISDRLIATIAEITVVLFGYDVHICLPSEEISELNIYIV